MSAPPLADDTVTLRGTGITIFRRTPGDPWRVDEAGVRSVVEELRVLGYEGLEGPWRVLRAVEEYLLNIAYFFPERTPGAGSALAMALGEPAPPLVGETLKALEEPSFDRYSYARSHKESDILREQRLSQREIEQLIHEDLKVDLHTVALRPLVATTENAARARWHYGVWGIYRRDANEQPNELIAVYGHHKGGFGGDRWYLVRDESDDDWNPWRSGLRDFKAVRCAVTGRLLYEWGRPAATLDPLTPELFVQGPPDIPGLGEFDEVVFAKDPTDPPKLQVAK